MSTARQVAEKIARDLITVRHVGLIPKNETWLADAIDEALRNQRQHLIDSFGHMLLRFESANIRRVDLLEAFQALVRKDSIDGQERNEEMAESLMECKDVDEVAALHRDHFDHEDFCVLTDGTTVWLSEQKRGSASVQEIQIPKHVFDALVRDYVKPQNRSK